MKTNTESSPHAAEAALPPTDCSALVGSASRGFVIQMTSLPFHYLEWWGDGEGGPFWCKSVEKAHVFPQRELAQKEQSILVAETQLIALPNDYEILQAKA